MSEPNETDEPEFVSQEFAGPKLSLWGLGLLGLMLFVGGIWLWQRREAVMTGSVTASPTPTLLVMATETRPVPLATSNIRAITIITSAQPITLATPDQVIDLGETMPFGAEWLPSGRGIVTADRNKIAFYDFPSMQITRTIPLTNPYARFYEIQIDRTEKELHLYEMGNMHSIGIANFDLATGGLITRYVNSLIPNEQPAVLYNSWDQKWQVTLKTDDWNAQILTNTIGIPVPVALTRAIQNCPITLNTRTLSDGKKIICIPNKISSEQPAAVSMIDLERLQSYQLTIPQHSPLIKIFAKTPQTFDSRFYQLTLSPNERYLAASNSSSIVIWDLMTRTYIGYSHIEPQDGQIHTVALHPNGKEVLISIVSNTDTFRPNSVMVRNMQNQALSHLDQNLDRLRYSPNGEFWLGLTEVGLQIFNTKDNTLYKHIPMSYWGSKNLTFHPDSQKLIVSSQFTRPMQYDLQPPQAVNLLSDRKLQGYGGHLDNTGRYWVEQTDNAKNFIVRVWDLGKQNLGNKDDADYFVNAICLYNKVCVILNENTDLLYFHSSNDKLIRYNLSSQTSITYTLPFTLVHQRDDRKPYVYAISPNGQWLAISNNGTNYDPRLDDLYTYSNATLGLYELNTEVQLRQAFSSTFAIVRDEKTLVFSGDSKRLFIVTRQGIEIIDLNPTQGIYQLVQSEINPYYFQTTYDGQRIIYMSLISASDQGHRVFIRDTCNGGNFFVLDDHSPDQFMPVLSPDGRILVTISDDNKIRLWRLPVSQC